MRSVWRGLALLVALCCLTWVGVLWWWQRQGREVQEGDLVLYLGVLPLVLFVLVLALRWAWRGAQARQAAAAAGAGAVPATASSEASAPAAGDDATRHLTWTLLHASVASPLAEEPAELLDAAEQGKPLPQPDPELLNSQGLPVLSVRSEDGRWPLGEVNDALQALPPSAARQAVDERGGPRAAWLRAMAAARPCWAAQIEWLARWEAAEQAAWEAANGGDAAAVPSKPLPAVSLRICLGLDADWSAPEQALARELVAAWWAQDTEDWAQRWQPGWEVVADSAEQLLLRVDQMLLADQRSQQRVWTLVLAAHSQLDQDAIDAWAAQGCLMEPPGQDRGRIPGEGAAALLLAPLGWAALPELETPAVLLHRPAVARRGKPIEAAGRVDHQMLAEVAQQALTVARLEPAALPFLVCDADQHSHRATELYGVTLDLLPHLDPVEDMRLLARVTGHVAGAGALTSLAAAAAWVRQHEKPCLVLSQAHALDRLAVVLRPVPAERGAAAV